MTAFKRILHAFGAIVLIGAGPWWLAVAWALWGLLAFPLYLEAVLWGFLMDALYGSHLVSWYSAPFAGLGLLAVCVASFLRSRMR
jgi:hypothetical protein